MNIFIDESGQFDSPKNVASSYNYECIVAVILNDKVLAEIENQYGDKDKKFLRCNAKEIIALLNESNCTIFMVITDSNSCQKNNIEAHKADYIKSIYQTSADRPSILQESIDYHAKKLSSTSSNEYIKALLMIRLLENVLRGIACRSTQFLNNDLTRFTFTCDDVTPGIVPTIKYFSSYATFHNSTMRPVDLDNKHNISHLIDKSGRYLNAKFIFEHINFMASKNSMGIRVADVIANQVFRILKEETVNYDLVALQKLFSNPYSVDPISFNKDVEFIENPIGKKALTFINGLGSNVQNKNNRLNDKHNIIMKQKKFFLYFFPYDEAPKTLTNCFMLGMLNFAALVIAVWFGYHAASYFGAKPYEMFPWFAIAIFFPATFLKPFFKWWENRPRS